MSSATAPSVNCPPRSSRPVRPLRSSLEDSREFATIFTVYCTAHRTLDEQLERFETAGSLSFPVLRDLVGDAADKGPLWWLKDHAHIVLRDADGAVSARLLDWGIGYVFHESLKLVEATHQHRHYLPELQSLADMLPPQEQEAACGIFTRISRELGEDMARGVRRMRYLLERLRAFFLLAAAEHKDNIHLARCIYGQEKLVRAVFGTDYPRLLECVYDGNHAILAALAAQALKEGGYDERAEAALLGAAEGSTRAV